MYDRGIVYRFLEFFYLTTLGGGGRLIQWAARVRLPICNPKNSNTIFAYSSACGRQLGTPLYCIQILPVKGRQNMLSINNHYRFKSYPQAPFYERVSLVAQNTYMIFNFCLNRAAKYRYRIFNAETLVRIQDTLTFFFTFMGLVAQW